MLSKSIAILLTVGILSPIPSPVAENATTDKPVQTVPSVADRFMTEFNGVIIGDKANTARQVRLAAEMTIVSGTKDIEGTFRRNAWRIADDPINGLPFDLIGTMGDLRDVAEALKTIE